MRKRTQGTKLQNIPHTFPSRGAQVTQKMAPSTNAVCHWNPWYLPWENATDSSVYVSASFCLAWLYINYSMGFNSYRREYNPTFCYKRSYNFIPAPSGRERNQTVGLQWINLYAPVPNAEQPQTIDWVLTLSCRVFIISSQIAFFFSLLTPLLTENIFSHETWANRLGNQCWS